MKTTASEKAKRSAILGLHEHATMMWENTYSQVVGNALAHYAQEARLETWASVRDYAFYAHKRVTEWEELAQTLKDRKDMCARNAEANPDDLLRSRAAIRHQAYQEALLYLIHAVGSETVTQ